MTKKRALKLIMAHGIQRNDAQHLLLIEHENGKTNLDAAWTVINANLFFDKIVEAAEAFRVSVEQMVDALNAITRRSFNENSCD